MRFTLIKDIKQDVGMKSVLSGLLIFTILYIIVDYFVKQSGFGVSPESVALTLFGNPDEFLDPMSPSSFLEFAHIEIFFIMMILLTLSAVYIRMSNKRIHSILIVNIATLGALVSLVALGGAYYFHEGFVGVYVVGSFVWRSLAFYMSVYSLWRLHFATSL